MLTEQQVHTIATKVNAKVNIPVIGEGFELFVYKLVVRLIDRKLEDILPPELYNAINNAADGLTDEEAKDLKKVAAKWINKNVDVPLLRERKEGKLFEAILGTIIDALRKGRHLEV